MRRALNRAGGECYRKVGIRALVDGAGHEVRDRERLIGEREFPRRFINFRPGTGLCNRFFFTAPGDEVAYRPRVEAFVGAAQKPHVAVGFDGGGIKTGARRREVAACDARQHRGAGKTRKEFFKVDAVQVSRHRPGGVVRHVGFAQEAAVRDVDDDVFEINDAVRYRHAAVHLRRREGAGFHLTDSEVACEIRGLHPRERLKVRHGIKVHGADHEFAYGFGCLEVRYRAVKG